MNESTFSLLQSVLFRTTAESLVQMRDLTWSVMFLDPMAPVEPSRLHFLFSLPAFPHLLPFTSFLYSPFLLFSVLGPRSHDEQLAHGKHSA